MITVEAHKDLRHLNTFGVYAFAKAYIPVSNSLQLKEALQYTQGKDPFILGGGSNILLLEDIDRPVIHLNISGITVEHESEKHVIVTAGAGENWHDLVMYCIKKRFAGIENLALIPGNIGTAPIQNIGAYGVELKDIFHSCEVMDKKTYDTQWLNRSQCKFGYRNSIFKKEARDKYVITKVRLRLHNVNSSPDYLYKTSYGAIEQELLRLKKSPGIESISQAVINIRTNKLPDPKVIGNGGSFFKNPIIDKVLYTSLTDKFKGLPSYPAGVDQVKVPAGYLIDHCGFKGYRAGDAGVHDRQALVLVNHGKATGREIIALAKTIQKKVKDTFGIAIEPEVNLIS